jgi:hypothetical protein
MCVWIRRRAANGAAGHVPSRLGTLRDWMRISHPHQLDTHTRSTPHRRLAHYPRLRICRPFCHLRCQHVCLQNLVRAPARARHVALSCADAPALDCLTRRRRCTSAHRTPPLSRPPHFSRLHGFRIVPTDGQLPRLPLIRLGQLFCERWVYPWGNKLVRHRHRLRGSRSACLERCRYRVARADFCGYGCSVRAFVSNAAHLVDREASTTSKPMTSL